MFVPPPYGFEMVLAKPPAAHCAMVLADDHRRFGLPKFANTRWTGKTATIDMI